MILPCSIQQQAVWHKHCWASTGKGLVATAALWEASTWGISTGIQTRFSLGATCSHSNSQTNSVSFSEARSKLPEPSLAILLIGMCHGFHHHLTHCRNREATASSPLYLPSFPGAGSLPTVLLITSKDFQDLWRHEGFYMVLHGFKPTPQILPTQNPSFSLVPFGCFPISSPVRCFSHQPRPAPALIFTATCSRLPKAPS